MKEATGQEFQRSRRLSRSTSNVKGDFRNQGRKTGENPIGGLKGGIGLSLSTEQKRRLFENVEKTRLAMG